MRLRCAVERAEERAALHPGAPAEGVDRHGAHRAQVDHEPVIGHGVPDDAVPAAADPDLESEIGGVSHGGDDIGRLRASHDVPRSSVDHPFHTARASS